MPPKRRRRFQGLYYHSSPPKVIPMNGQLSNQNGRKRREVDDFSVKLSTIRIWMHEKDIGNLTRILWAGQGNRLRQQASTNPKVKRFLAAVPYVMNSIKDVHQAVIDNNLETLQATLEPPVPPALITCKDANGLNAIHKAAGMGHTKILEYLIETWPDGINEIDITGKTPLHWAASAKNNMRCYTLLTQAGCDEEVVDYKMKTPSYYRHKPHEIERAFLVYVPEAPRVSPGIATDWEALCDDGGDGKKLEIKIPEINGVSLRTTDDSIDITSDADLNDSVSGTEEDEVAKDDEVQPVENGVESVPETPDNLDEEAEPELELVPEPELEPKTKPEPEEEETDDVVAPAPEEEDENPENNSLIETTMTTDKDDNDQAEENDNDQTEKDGSSQTDVDEKGGDIEAIEESAQVEKNDDDKESAQQNEAMSNVDHDDEATADVGEKDEENTNDNDKEAVKDEEDIANSDNEEQLELNVNANNNDDIKDNKTNEINDEDIVEMQTNDRELVDDDTNNMNESIVNANEEQNTTPNNEETDKTEDIMNIDSNTSETNEENDKNENEAADNENNKIVFINVKTDLETGEETVVEKNKLIENTEESKETVGEDAEEPADEKEVTENGEDSNKIKENGVSTDKNGTKTTKSDAEEDEEEDEDLKEQFDDNDDITGAETELVFDEQETVTGEPEPEPEPKVELYAETDEPLDENHNADKYDSPTSSLAIEGFVQGESEDNTVQSQSAAFVDEASRIQEIIASGDMEQLAEIVLNGDGSKLLDMQSPEAEIQAFLNNVPNYMGKIRRVHEAAREGSLLSLQQALDRRKFAIAKDEISPNGATPLHVAVLFGHTDIVRYLAARFTETTTATDNDGRTALHYAATIKDNGHFYNLLAQLGANPKSVDKLGHTPEFFLDAESSQDILSYRQLLSSFGAADLEQALLSDQGQVENNSFQTNPIFKTEQGKYLANTLADPLIKALTEIANTRPEDPIAFLTDFLQSYMRKRNPNAIVPAEAIHPSSSKTNSTAVVNSNSPPMRKANNYNGVSNGNAEDEIEEDRMSIATEDDEPAPQLDDRDEHGQSMLHFACARSHRRGGLMHLIEESNIDITYRDELYRTARDVSLQANQPSNAKEIDRFVLSLAVVGDLKPFENLAASGYDHITDVVDDNGRQIIDIVADRENEELADFLRNLRALEESREELHQMIRENKIDRIKEITAASNARWLIKARNYYGRTALHIAVLKESEELVELFVNISPEALRVGDNLERTALHYAMGTNAIESISRILIQKGAKRTTKDLKGRQPSYYFMNKADVLRLQEEEDENH